MPERRDCAHTSRLQHNDVDVAVICELGGLWERERGWRHMTTPNAEPTLARKSTEVGKGDLFHSFRSVVSVWPATQQSKITYAGLSATKPRRVTAARTCGTEALMTDRTRSARSCKVASARALGDGVVAVVIAQKVSRPRNSMGGVACSGSGSSSGSSSLLATASGRRHSTRTFVSFAAKAKELIRSTSS